MGIHFHQRDQFVRIIELTPALRREIEATVESLIALLDSYDGDENLEEDTPLEDGADEEPTLGAPENHPSSRDTDWTGRFVPRSGKLYRVPDKSQERWAAGSTRDDECEEENEHGGDILDEPHDEDADDEPSLAFTEALDQSSPHRWGEWSDLELDLTE